MSAYDYKFHPKKRCSIIAAPFHGGQPKSGVEEGPMYLLQAGLQHDVEKLNWECDLREPLKNYDIHAARNDARDVHEHVKRPKMVAECTKLIHDCVAGALSEGRLPLTIGGDHSVAIGTVSGVLSRLPDCGVIWVDAHADINTMSGTLSGNLHGCPVSILMGLDREHTPPHFNWVPHNLKPSKIAYIALRDVDEDEKRILHELDIAAFCMHHIDRYGMNRVVKMAMDAVCPRGTEPIMVSYDVDAIDPLTVPATGTPVRGGLTFREAVFLMERVAETGRLAALDVVECNPKLASSPNHMENTINMGCSIARCALGETLLHPRVQRSHL